MENTDVHQLISELKFQRDERNPPNRWHKPKFKMGWKEADKWRELGATYRSQVVLEALNWQNLGTYVGGKLGQRSDDEISQIFDLFAKNYYEDLSSVEKQIDRLTFNNQNRRKRALSRFLDVVRYADQFGKSKWRVRLSRQERRESRGCFQLLVGQFLVFSIEWSSNIWLALDSEMLQQTPNTLWHLSRCLRQDDFHHRNYRPLQVPSECGYLCLEDESDVLWDLVKPPLYRFIEKAASECSLLNQKVQREHDLRIILFLERELNQFVPEPIYDFDQEEEDYRLPQEISEEDAYSIWEGARQKVTVNAYERDPQARQQCIAHYGYRCYICNFDFEEKYGELGKGYIEVHHEHPLSIIREVHKVNPIIDMKPICPNCHAVIHRRNPPYAIEDMRQIFR